MACEKCWRDAWARFYASADPSKDVSDHYRDLLAERRDSPCTPEQERGEDLC